jgi:hypothetical protein
LSVMAIKLRDTYGLSRSPCIVTVSSDYLLIYVYI